MRKVMERIKTQFARRAVHLDNADVATKEAFHRARLEPGKIHFLLLFVFVFLPVTVLLRRRGCSASPVSTTARARRINHARLNAGAPLPPPTAHTPTGVPRTDTAGVRPRAQPRSRRSLARAGSAVTVAEGRRTVATPRPHAPLRVQRC